MTDVVVRGMGEHLDAIIAVRKAQKAVPALECSMLDDGHLTTGPAVALPPNGTDRVQELRLTGGMIWHDGDSSGQSLGINNVVRT